MEGGLREPGTPDDVVVTDEARRPVDDSTLGIPLAPKPAAGNPRHRLVSLGDSLTHGFKNFAVRDTRLSYPALIARELGWEREFRVPSYDSPGGLPLDLEWLQRELEGEFGDRLSGFGEATATFNAARRLLETHEDFWERGIGSRFLRPRTIHHNLAIYGWDLRDALSRTADTTREELVPAVDNRLPGLPQNAGAIAALRVLDSARDAAGKALTPIEAATQLGTEGSLTDAGEPLPDEDGIETLTIFLGANNALPTVLRLGVRWSRMDYADLEAKQAYTVWRPTHFAAELRAVADAIRRVRARHVLWITVPHVTIAPIARGFGGKVGDRSRYFPYYARPWVREESLLADPTRYPHLTAGQVRAVDSAIDQYNEAICDEVRAAREAGLDWHVIDLCGVLDRLATRRYVEHPEARPDWWTPYELPQALIDALGFTPTTEFVRSDPDGITGGGIVGLDGVHPTTSGYSIIAHECIKVMKRAGVRFYTSAGEEREDPRVDFAGIASQDTLLSRPLRSGVSTLELLGMLDERFALIAGFERAVGRGQAAAAQP
jgi:hypothetical protein